MIRPFASTHITGKIIVVDQTRMHTTLLPVPIGNLLILFSIMKMDALIRRNVTNAMDGRNMSTIH
jgi:high-affinity K+ transport system ATPase subunit B